MTINCDELSNWFLGRQEKIQSGCLELNTNSCLYLKDKVIQTHPDGSTGKF